MTVANVCRIACLALAAAALPLRAYAQGTTLTVTGFPLTFASPTAADFAAGAIESAATTAYQLAAANTGGKAARTAVVSVRALSQSGTAVLQWRRADTATWTTLTTTPATVEQVALSKGTTSSNAIAWRYLLSWTGDPPGVSAASIAITLTVTIP